MPSASKIPFTPPMECLPVAKIPEGDAWIYELKLDGYPNQDRFDVQLPFALALSTELSPFRYDAVVVDEAQDFGDEFWFPLICLLVNEKESTFYVFFDHNQAIYKPSRQIPVDDDPFVLTTNCRNTTHIHDAAYHYYMGIQTDGPEIMGEPVTTLCAPSIRAQATRLHALVTQLIVKEAVSPSEIAVLVAAPGKTGYYSEIRDKPLPQSAKWSFEAHRIPSSVLVDTVARFKGLEAAIVILWGLQELTPDVDREILYVGLSRAKSRLYLVGTEQVCSRLMQYQVELGDSSSAANQTQG